MNLACLLILGSLDAGPAELNKQPSGDWRFGTGVELEAGVMSSQGEPNGLDGLAQLRPLVSVSHRTDFDLKLAPLFRFRIVDSEALNRTDDIASILRGRDFDELSDLGNVIDSLRFNQRFDSVFFNIKTTTQKSLGLGHVVRRYSARENADYRPASGTLAVWLSPLRVEFFASDILSPRIFALDVRLDVGRLFTTPVNDRFFVALQLAYDAGLTGVQFRPGASFQTPSASLANADVSLVLFRNASIGIAAIGGAALRFDTKGFGALFGVAADWHIEGVLASVKLEARWLSEGNFRFGFFGPTYEIARFSDVGFSGQSIGQRALTSGGTLDAEIKVSTNDFISFDAHAEYFLFGRTDIDTSLELSVIKNQLFLSAQLAIVGIGEVLRFHVNSNMKFRIAKGFYVSANGATMMSPQSDGRILRGYTISAGLGLDLASSK
jgi:hypothetical protein